MTQMTKELRRKQKKAKRTLRAAKRKAVATMKANAPQFESDLPMTPDAIEGEMQRLLPEAITEKPLIIKVGEPEPMLRLAPTMLRLVLLQKQLFRVVFRREPRPDDPIFWDRTFEKRGVFPIESLMGGDNLSEALMRIEVRPDIAYASKLTGVTPIESDLHLYEKDDLERWEEAAQDYVHQEETGVPPVTPDRLMNTLERVNGAAENPKAVGSVILDELKTSPNRFQVAIEAALKRHQNDANATRRIAALLDIAEDEEFRNVVSPPGFTRAAMIAASSAEIDVETGKFVPESFRERLEVALSKI